MVYLPLAQAEQFFGAEGLATSVALDIESKEEVPAVLAALESAIDTTELAVKGWEEMIPDLVEAKELDAAGNNLVLIILYLIITFGIFGTILMMTRERSYEFGVLIGIGMHRWQLSLIVWDGNRAVRPAWSNSWYADFFPARLLFRSKPN